MLNSLPFIRRNSISFFFSGAFFALGWLVFFDGMLFGKMCGVPYNFLMWIPGIFMLCSTFLFCFIDGNTILQSSGGTGDGIGGLDAYYTFSETVRDRIFFFLACMLSLFGLCSGVWRMMIPYGSGVPGVDPWAGIAILVQTILFGLTNLTLFLGNVLKNDSSELVGFLY